MIWVTIAALGVTSFLLRAAFLLLPVWRSEVPEAVRSTLALVPPAAFAALVAPSLLLPGGEFRPVGPATVAAVVAVAVALRWRNLSATMAAGFVAYALADLLL
jgi:branched-subunit amino acid transport protein